ncbi:MAG: hypothetical protein JW726_16025 [Anaerolineales bacterium]|nr:hypothetical protein [Anaerolineales bacterium]
MQTTARLGWALREVYPKMIVGIHPDLIGKESYSDRWAEVLRARGVEVRLLNLLAADALQQAATCDGIMWRWAHNPQDKQSAQRILYTIEHYLNIPVYPDSRTAWHYDEKVAQCYLLQALEAPTPATWLFWKKEDALRWAETAPYPLVFKLSSGAGSSNVVKVTDRQEARRLIEPCFERGIFPYTLNEYRKSAIVPISRYQMFQFWRRLKDSVRFLIRAEYPALPSHTFWKPEFGYAYFQEFLSDNHFDTRVTVIGDRAFAFRRMNRSGDFRASGSGLIEFDPALIDPRCLQIAFQVSERGRFQSMAYDFLYKEGAPVICEISYAYADWAVQKCPGHWKPDLTWQEGNMWPEEAQAEDFIKRIESRQKIDA